MGMTVPNLVFDNCYSKKSSWFFFQMGLCLQQASMSYTTQYIFQLFSNKSPLPLPPK